MRDAAEHVDGHLHERASACEFFDDALVFVLGHHQYLAVAAYADARLRRFDLAATDALPGLDVVGHVSSSSEPANPAHHDNVIDAMPRRR